LAVRRRPLRASEVEVRFTADGPDQTTVNLEHRHLDRLVNGQTMQDQIVEAGGGWSTLLDLFATTAAGPRTWPSWLELGVSESSNSGGRRRQDSGAKDDESPM
jgi:hypothetical protein